MNVINKVTTLPNSCYTVLHWSRTLSLSLLHTLDITNDSYNFSNYNNIIIAETIWIISDQIWEKGALCAFPEFLFQNANICGTIAAMNFNPGMNILPSSYYTRQSARRGQISYSRGSKSHTRKLIYTMGILYGRILTWRTEQLVNSSRCYVSATLVRRLLSQELVETTIIIMSYARLF